MTERGAAARAALALSFEHRVDRDGPVPDYAPELGPCWLWTGATTVGYGRFRGSGVHRMAYEELVGPIPDGLVMDHLCRVRHCVNPAHLEPVTLAENVRRGLSGRYQASKTHCPQGHEYSPENTYVTKVGQRKCRTCYISRRRADRVRARFVKRPLGAQEEGTTVTKPTESIVVQTAEVICKEVLARADDPDLWEELRQSLIEERDRKRPLGVQVPTGEGQQ